MKRDGQEQPGVWPRGLGPWLQAALCSCQDVSRLSRVHCAQWRVQGERPWRRCLGGKAGPCSAAHGLYRSGGATRAYLCGQPGGIFSRPAGPPCAHCPFTGRLCFPWSSVVAAGAGETPCPGGSSLSPCHGADRAPGPRGFRESAASSSQPPGRQGHSRPCEPSRRALGPTCLSHLGAGCSAGVSHFGS